MKAKEKLGTIIHNHDATVGLVGYPDFHGVTVPLDLKYPEEAIRFLHSFEDMGFSLPKITIGIEPAKGDDAGTFILFINESLNSGIAVAPLRKEEGSVDD